MPLDSPAAPPRLEDTAEGVRLAADVGERGWRTWGPYLSERQWGTVREDYSADGSAWDYFPHDHARSRAYRWGEDGLGGFADAALRTCMSVALWNGRDPILKERLFGLTNAEGNHGEDVKELYYYLDGAPTHSYMKMLYKYPQQAFPYSQLVQTNAARGLDEGEFELIDTGAFDESRYFDVEIEYAKAAPEDILLLITAHNRGPETATLHVLPQLWFRNLWSWDAGAAKPSLTASGNDSVLLSPVGMPQGVASFEAAPALMFCDNETNVDRLYGAQVAGFFKDAVNDAVVAGRAAAVNPERTGTKVAAHYTFQIAPGQSARVRVRLRPKTDTDAFADFDAIVAQRRAETDAFYAALQVGIADPDRRLVQRQAIAGLLWCKQYYGYDIRRWLAGDPTQPPPPAARGAGRNADWGHVVFGDVDPVQGGDIICMPDSWEYPWFAAWDLAFHCVTLALVDPAFAKTQLTLLTQARSLHPNGEIPAYEWSFGDVNPPVQAWAALQIFERERQSGGAGDLVFLERIFHKLMLNFTWWVNREDAEGRNIFQGGFLGLDNIGLFDLRKPLPGGGRLDQCDGTAWAAAFALKMMRIALELALHNRVYEDLATKFFEHFLYIAEAIHGSSEKGPTGLWDEQDQFYYDILREPGQAPQTLRIRSVVGLVPLFAVEVLHDDFRKALPQFCARMDWFVQERPDMAGLVSNWRAPNGAGLCLLSLVRKHRLNAVLTRMLDESEFLSAHGLRAVSQYHRDRPYRLEQSGQVFTLQYEPAEGRTRIYGGNSNWRGPVWMPINYLVIEALKTSHAFYRDEFQMECPTGSGHAMTLGAIAATLTERLLGLFLKDADGRRTYLGAPGMQTEDPHFQHALLFHEYFDGDTGKGLGASHQTGWTALAALLLEGGPVATAAAPG